ncbi:MAG TPA: HAMP domain-containing sensor histidine kinase [Stellaceae bacterium]|nr:HAMP domain-containing sensor histidine kinase [Stellaceae bacterium]
MAKSALLAAIFIIVPIILYGQFSGADDQKRQLVMAGVRDQGRIIGAALAPLLISSGGNLPALGPALGRELARFGDEVTRIKLLYRPASGASGFFYIASSLPLTNSDLDLERDNLRTQGVLDRLNESCTGDLPIAVRYRAEDGHDEVVTSVTPVQTPAGCWAVVTSLAATSVPGLSLGVPYYATPEVRLAGIIYLVMALLTFTTFWSIWRGLSQFGQHARAIRSQDMASLSFGARNEVPELAEVAEEFDRLVDTLRNSAQDLRQTAEDNAHAFKTPIAIIRQSLEPVVRAIPPGHLRAQRAIGLIESSLDKLDGLVASSRQLDEATADLLGTRRIDLDLSALLHRIIGTHTELFRTRGISTQIVVDRAVVVRANEDMIETVIENVLENAISFSQAGDQIGIALGTRGDFAELLINDNGPGVPPANLPRIFDRYFSSRPSIETDEVSIHFGVGLWIVRRNVEAMGGHVTAENCPPRGLMIRIGLPLKRAARGEPAIDGNRRP